MKLIIFDRDGTINEDSDDFIKSPEEWLPIPGALEAIARLNHAGWHTVIASNQSGLGRGLFDISALNAIHAKLHKQLAALGGRMDAVFFCPHTPEDKCSCRKPLPGLYEQILDRMGADASGVLSVGDALRDMQATVAAGCEPHLVLTGKAASLRGQTLASAAAPALSPALAPALGPEYPAHTKVHLDLTAFADFVIKRDKAKI